jgi:hypothetical protein
MTVESLRDKFLRLFAAAMTDADPTTLRAAWASQGARTHFYSNIFARVAAGLDLDLEQELLIVDYAMVGKDDGVPRIFIESENIAFSAVQEVRKLCCLAAPLKVLFSVCEWDESESLWKNGSMRPHLLPEWRQAVAKHKAAGTFCGDIIAVVAEWRPDDSLRFYSLSLLDSAGDDAILYVRAVGSPGAETGHHNPVA